MPIRIIANTIMPVELRTPVEEAIQQALKDTEGEWLVWLTEESRKEWDVKIEGQLTLHFRCRDLWQRKPDYIADEVSKAVGHLSVKPKGD